MKKCVTTLSDLICSECGNVMTISRDKKKRKISY